MAIKLSGSTVISDTYHLENIANTDATSALAINQAIKSQNNALRIYDSSGTQVRIIYGAQE